MRRHLRAVDAHLAGEADELRVDVEARVLRRAEVGEEVHQVEVPLGRVAVARVAVGEPPGHRDAVPQRAAGDDGHVEAAAVPRDDRGLLRVEPLREVGEHVALALVLADDAEALGHVVLEQQAARG